MINSLTLLDPDLKKRIASGQFRFEFKPGINILLGSNGSGKSTLFDALVKGDLAIKLGKIEIDCDPGTDLRSVRMSEQGRNTDMNNAEGLRYRHGLMSQFRSHGQALWPILNSMKGLPAGATFMMDEPEQALDATRTVELRKLIKQVSSNSQVILATHDPILLTLPGANLITVDKDQDYLNTVLSIYQKLFTQNDHRSQRTL